MSRDKVSVYLVYCVNCKALFLEAPWAPTLVNKPNRQCPACHRFAETKAVDLHVDTGDGEQEGYYHEPVCVEVQEPFGE